MIIPVILAGGSGKRLWPISRTLYPKQFINLTGNYTLFQDTLKRVSSIDKIQPPIILCNESHRFTVAEQLRLINIDQGTIILEPVGRNTAPALTTAAMKALCSYKDPILLILPADHFIADVNEFIEKIKCGVSYAEKGYLIAFGILPTYPETGYGYIKKGVSLEISKDDGIGVSSILKIDKFVEKPDKTTAERYLASGDYYWNSGMFMFKASTLLENINKYSPAVAKACDMAVKNGKEDLDFFRLETKSFTDCPSDSIDYAVMEKTEDGLVIPLATGWTDLGSWEALWKIGEKDHNNNVVHGDVCIKGVSNSYIHSTSRLVSAIGLDRNVVIETKDAVFVSPREKVQNVQDIVSLLKKQQRPEVDSHKKVFRPWGSYESIDISDRYQVKRISVKPGAKLSLQKHFNRAEHWVVVSGTALATRGEEEIMLKEDQSTYIPVGMVHRLENPGKVTLDLIEVQTGGYLEEDDIVRYDDVYGRGKEI